MTVQSIVIADENIEWVDALRTRLDSVGVKVFTAFDAFNLLNLIYERDPDLICLDPKLYNGDGLNALEMLATENALGDAQVILMTGDCELDSTPRSARMTARCVRKSDKAWANLESLLPSGHNTPLPVASPLSGSWPAVCQSMATS